MRQLRRRDREHDLGCGPTERDLDLGLLERRLARTELGIDRGRAHEQAAQHHVARGPRREWADQASGPAVELTAGEQCGDAGVFLQGPERVGPVGEHGEIAHAPEPCREPLQGRRRVDADRAARADHVDQLLGETRLGARVLTKAGGELLWSHGDGPAAHALGHAFVDEHVEVAADRHLAHVELVGELRDPDAAVRVEAVPHQLEPFERLDVHRATSWSSASVARAVSASAKAPNAIPCTSAFPIAVASTGPVETGSGVRRCNASRYSADRDPPPNTRMPRTSWPSLEGSEWTTLCGGGRH